MSIQLFPKSVYLTAEKYARLSASTRSCISKDDIFFLMTSRFGESADIRINLALTIGTSSTKFSTCA
jgi:hypothetical protein